MAPRPALGWKVVVVFSICVIVFLSFGARNESLNRHRPVGHTQPHLAEPISEFTHEHTSVADHKPIQTPLSKPGSKPQSPTIKSHGYTPCLPSLDKQLVEKSATWSTSCRKYSPFPPESKRVPTISASFGNRKRFVERAYRSHMLHSLIQRQDIHVMCDPIVDGMWNKQAFLLKLMYEQMLLPERDRYDWFFWADADTLVLDPCRPSSMFLPPGNSTALGAKEIHLIAAEDANGLNAGVFFIRVSAWSINFLESVLAFRNYKPDVKLRFAEQSAMAELLKTEEFENEKVFVPWHWFNAYPNSEGDHGPHGYAEGNDTGLRNYQARRGDFMVHFAGDWDKNEPIKEWAEAAEEVGNVWEKGSALRDVSKDIEKFWIERGYVYEEKI